MENKTTLRESFNKVSIVGVVKENNLEYYEKEGRRAVRGDLVIKTGENSEHKLKCYAGEITSKGKVNPSFNSLEKAMSYTSLATLMASGISKEDALEQASKVVVDGAKLKMNDYYNSNKKDISSYPEISFSFIETVKKEFTPQAFFDIEGVVTKMTPEIKDEEETGRLRMTVVSFDYHGNAMPFEFVTSQEAGSYLEANYEIGKTSNLWGELVSTIDVVVQEKEGFGSSKTQTFENITNEMLILSGKPEQYDEDDSKAYNVEAVKTALANREIVLEKMKSDGESGSDVKKGFSQPNQAPSQNNTQKKVSW